MRLLRFRSNGQLTITEFLGDDIPPYAILSHTWGRPDEEVTFKDIVEGKGELKRGYRKIRFCWTRVEDDELEYFWIDSCCIDRSSSAEVSEAINSMFRWYRNAEVCYVYLSDVDYYINRWGDPGDYDHLLRNFRGSRWFTRGWTLQELLAPTDLYFYSSDCVLLGSKLSLIVHVDKATGIPLQAISGHTPLSQYDAEGIISWGEYRETTREEDAAYCLLGLLDISMPVIYGEGRDKAFRRLQKEIWESSGDKPWMRPKNGF